MRLLRKKELQIENTCAILLTVVVSSVFSQTNLKQNFWIEWANRTKTEAFCLHLTAAVDPFQTCLIGVPVPPNNIVVNESLFDCSNYNNNSQCVAELIRSSYETLPWDPQELNLLGSRDANHSGCIWFGHWNLTERKPRAWLTPHGMYHNASKYCGEEPYGWRSGQKPLFISKPLALPKNVYLICGDRAWQGVPKGAHGGPCYLGRLSLLSPDKSFLKRASENKTKSRFQRSLEVLDPSCNDEVELWDVTARVFAAIVPCVGTAQALTQLQHLACWSAKHANVTTQILASLAQDMSGLRKAVLQNRAAIDYLLLAQGKGCEDFEGMCCFNVSDHSKSIHKQLQWLQEHTEKITINHNPLDDWLMSFGISAWVKEGIKIAFIILLIVLLVLCMGPCIIQCFSFQIKRMADSVFDKRGGDVAGLAGAISLLPFHKKIP